MRWSSLWLYEVLAREMIVKEEESLNQVSRKSLREGELQSDSGVLWNVLEDLHLLILNRVLFFSCSRSLVLWHNGVKLSRASWELTFTLPLTLTVLQFCNALQFLRAVFKCQPGGYVRSTSYFICVTFSWMELLLQLKWSCIF